MSHPRLNLFVCLRQSSLSPPWLKTYRSGTHWPCLRSPWWTVVRSGWCRPTFHSRLPSVKANRPCTTVTPLRDRVGALSALPLSFLTAWCCFDIILTEGFLEVSHGNCGHFSCGHFACVVHSAVVRISPCHSRQPSVISDASAADGDRSSTPSDINSPRHRTHSLCNVRAAWPPRPSNGTSTLSYKYLPLLCLVLFVSVSLSCQPAGCSPAWRWWWSWQWVTSMQ